LANLDIQKFRADAQAFLSRSDKEYYLHFSGRKDSLETASIFDKYSWLFTVSNMQYLQQKKQQEAGQSRKKYSYLLKFCTEYLLEKSLQQLRQQIALDEAAARVNIDGKDMPFRFLEVMLANEPDKARRDHIEKLRNDKIEEALNPNLYQYWEEVHQQARQFGFDSYSHLFSNLLEQDFDLLQAGMKKLLSETHQLYQNHFGQLLYQELGINLGQSARSDFIYLKRGQKYDPYFSTHKMIGLFSETLKQLGIDIYSQKNIIFDIEKRKKGILAIENLKKTSKLTEIEDSFHKLSGINQGLENKKEQLIKDVKEEFERNPEKRMQTFQQGNQIMLKEIGFEEYLSQDEDFKNNLNYLEKNYQKKFDNLKKEINRIVNS